MQNKKIGRNSEVVMTKDGKRDNLVDWEYLKKSLKIGRPLNKAERKAVLDMIENLEIWNKGGKKQ